MKKIGLAINFNYPDYGGMLQAFSTQLFLNNNGIETEVIDYSYLVKKINKRKFNYFIHSIFDFSIIHEKAGFVFKIIKTKIDKDFKKKMLLRNKALLDFSSKNFHTTKRFTSFEELTNYCDSMFSAVVVGSDQLWLPSNIWGDFYTLNFVPDNVRRISYATSFGVSALPKNTQKKASAFLNRFDCLSSREKTGQDIVKKLINKKPILVCDPTLLIDQSQWMDFVPKERLIKEKYIFCYFMGNNPEQRRLVKSFGDKKDLIIVTLPFLDKYLNCDKNYADISLFNIDPFEFLNLIFYSEFVFTDSFHGSVFSIIFQKLFLTFRRFKNKGTLSTNSRLDTLLEELDLKERLIVNNPDSIDCVETKIDYNLVNQKIALIKKKSENYLLDSIKNDKN